MIEIGGITMESDVFTIHREGHLVYLTIPAFDKTGLVHHCFSTKLGGVSEGIYESMNVSFGRGDSDENVKKNLEILCGAVGIDAKDLVFSDQIHEDVIMTVDEDDRGKGIVQENDRVGVDGLMTNRVKVPLHTTYADCVPLYFLDTVKKIIAISHAGWRGTVKAIGAKTVNKMVEVYDSQPKDILACIAPSIGPCCFEVGEEVVQEFRQTFSEDDQKKVIRKMPESKYKIDLWTANKLVLLSAGILPEHITVTDICTKCNHDVMFSHRATKGKRGSLAAIMELKP